MVRASFGMVECCLEPWLTQLWCSKLKGYAAASGLRQNWAHQRTTSTTSDRGRAHYACHMCSPVRPMTCHSTTGGDLALACHQSVSALWPNCQIVTLKTAAPECLSTFLTIRYDTTGKMQPAAQASRQQYSTGCPSSHRIHFQCTVHPTTGSAPTTTNRLWVQLTAPDVLTHRSLAFKQQSSTEASPGQGGPRQQ